MLASTLNTLIDRFKVYGEIEKGTRFELCHTINIMLWRLSKYYTISKGKELFDQENVAKNYSILVY